MVSNSVQQRAITQADTRSVTIDQSLRRFASDQATEVPVPFYQWVRLRGNCGFAAIKVNALLAPRSFLLLHKRDRC